MRTFILITSIFLFVNLSAQYDLNRIDSIVLSAVENEFFEGTLLIADQGKPIFHRSFGTADHKTQQPIQNESTYRVASITKLFTAIVIMQLVEESQFSIDDNIARLLPDVDIPNRDNITVHHLLLHISGLPNENGLSYTQQRTPREMIQMAINEEKPKGKFEEYQYNNVDYFLLGLIIEKFTGKTWQQAVTDRILNTLELKETGFLVMDDEPDNYVLTYQVDEDGNFVADPKYHIENFYAAACMYSTTTDLLKLDQAMYSDDFISAVSKQQMFTSYPEYNYTGYSVWTYNYPFAKNTPSVMERRGGILGANVVLLRILSLNRTIIILSNNNRFDPDTFGDLTSLREALLIEMSQ